MHTRHTAERPTELTRTDEMQQSKKAEAKSKVRSRNLCMNKNCLLPSEGIKTRDFRINTGQTVGHSVVEGKEDQQRMPQINYPLI